MISVITAAAYLIKDITAIVSMLMIMRFIFLQRINKNKILITVFGAVLLLNAVSGSFLLADMTEDYRAVMDIVSDIVYVFALRFLTDCKKLSRCIWLLLIYIVTAEMFYSLLSPYTSETLWAECVIYIIFFSAVCAVLFFAVRKSEVNFLPKVFEEIPKWIYAVLLLFELTCYYKEFGISYDWYNILYIVSSATVTLCVLYLVFKIFYLAHQQNIIIQQMAIQKDFGEQALSGDEELRRFRHDYKNHMIVVNAYLENGKVDEARRYLTTMNDSINGVINKIRSGNFVADAVLNNKSVAAAKKGISLKFSGFIPGEGIANEDLCTILSNLIDNAIEATEKVSSERIITIEASIKNGFFILGITNPTINKIESEKGRIKTSKQDKRAHGYGLKNVERTIKKYKGAFSTSLSSGVFSADIRMKL
ncbi:MAG: sensor histidine kinase [Acutalibacteraceae bacterium]